MERLNKICPFVVEQLTKYQVGNASAELEEIRFVRIGEVQRTNGSSASPIIKLLECEDKQDALMLVKWHSPGVVGSFRPHMLTDGVHYCIVCPWFGQWFEITYDSFRYNTPGMVELREWLKTL